MSNALTPGRTPTKMTRPPKRKRQDQSPCHPKNSKNSTTSTTITNRPAKDQTTTLLTLPPEIRNQIYNLVLSSSSTPSYLCPFALSVQAKKYSYSLTQTCRQLRLETLPHFYATKTLLLNLRAANLPHYIAWLKHLPQEAFPAIRQVLLEDYQHVHDNDDAEHASMRGNNRHPGYCSSAIVVNLGKGFGRGRVRWRRDKGCFWCGDKTRDATVERVRAVVGGWASEVSLRRERLEGVLRAVGWDG